MPKTTRYTADTITEEQIRELWADYAITGTEATLALVRPGERRFSHESREMHDERLRLGQAARTRCAEILNARSTSATKPETKSEKCGADADNCEPHEQRCHTCGNRQATHIAIHCGAIMAWGH